MKEDSTEAVQLTKKQPSSAGSADRTSFLSGLETGLEQQVHSWQTVGTSTESSGCLDDVLDFEW